MYLESALEIGKGIHEGDSYRSRAVAVASPISFSLGSFGHLPNGICYRQSLSQTQ